MVKKGHFIVVEGLEGAGKTTAINTIKRYLASYVSELIVTREPGGTHVGDVARRLIKDIVPDEPLDARAELLLFYAARVQLMQRVVLPALENGTWVIADRFELSTLAYQGGGRKLDASMISQLSAFCLDKFKPDLIVFLDVKPELGLQRAFARGKTDRIEQEALAFFQDVYDSYHHHIKHMDNVVVIDAGKPISVVRRSIKAALETYMNKHAN